MWSAIALFQAFLQHIARCSEGKAREDQQSDHYLSGVTRYRLPRELDDLQKFALRGVEACP